LLNEAKGIEERLEEPRLAQPPEALPDRVPLAELRRENPPTDILDREIDQCLEEFAVIAPLSPRRERTAEKTSSTIVHHCSSIRVSMPAPPNAGRP
jgi:hypothetical protein